MTLGVWEKLAIQEGRYYIYHGWETYYVGSGTAFPINFWSPEFIK